MAWVVGIDEAGYGPNLGPLVQAAAALELPAEDHSGWTTLKHQIRKCSDDVDNRILIDDSKKVYSGVNGLNHLEKSIFAVLQIVQPISLIDFLKRVSVESWLTSVIEEPWFDGSLMLPLTTFEDLQSSINISLPLAMIAARVTTAQEVNSIIDQSGSKATVLSMGLIQLIRQTLQTLPEFEPVRFLCDKQGGRNFYGPMLAHAFPEGWVVALKESANDSYYRIESMARPVEISFRPRADGESTTVALSSMFCKYLRELFMHQWNTFWKEQIPEIKPTAGYPTDAKRFFAEIQPTLLKMRISDESVWRKK